MSEYKTTTTVRRRKKKKNKALKAILGVLVAAALIVLIGLAAFFIIFRFTKDDPEVIPPEFSDASDEYTTVNEGDKTSIDMIQEMRSDKDLSSILRDWATNNTENSVMYRDSVVNILLLGVDQSGSSNADVIMMATVDSENEKIFLTSFMRDSYTFIDAPNGKSYAKVNAAYCNGGADCVVETIQNDYKIRIDNYVSVNFWTFSKIVDAIGGVTVPVKQYEAEEMWNLSTWGDSVTLNGDQALAYCRIRHCDADGDVSRTRRQRQFISALIDRTKEVSVSQMTEAVTTLLQYVKTDCSSARILSLGTRALREKWYDYDIISLSMPAPDFRMDYYGNAWVWIVDYPAAAQYLQTMIYGESNIKLNTDRVTAIDVMQRRQTGEARP